MGLLMVIFLYYLPLLYFAEVPSENWWTALSIIVAIGFGVITLCILSISLSVKVLFSEKDSKEKLASLEEDIKKYSTDKKKSHKDILSFISSILDVQNVSETEIYTIWERVNNNIDKINKIGILKSQTVRIWSEIAWKQGHLDIACSLREKAYQLDSKDFRNRVMLCSILTQDKKPDITRIENIFNNTDLKSDGIIDQDIDHFYNVKGMFYKKIGKFKEASESFKKALELNIQTWPFNEYIITLIMREDIDNEFIKNEIDRIKKIPNSKWLDETDLYQKVFRLFVNGFINKLEIDKFYNCLTPLMISKLTYRYDNQYVKEEFFNFYSQITKKYNEKELNILYLTFYKLLGVYDDQANNELQKPETLDEINKKIS